MFFDVRVGHRSPAKRVCRILDFDKCRLGRLLYLLAPKTAQRKKAPCGPPRTRSLHRGMHRGTLEVITRSVRLWIYIYIYIYIKREREREREREIEKEREIDI